MDAFVWDTSTDVPISTKACGPTLTYRHILRDRLGPIWFSFYLTSSRQKPEAKTYNILVELVFESWKDGF